MILPLLVLTVVMLSSCSSSPSQPAQPSGSLGANLATCLENCQIDSGMVSKDTCGTGCYMKEATERKDPEVCVSNITDTLMLSACLTKVAQETKDITICDKIGTDINDLMRGVCYITIAKKTKDASLCEKMKDSLSYLGCVEATDQINPKN